MSSSKALTKKIVIFASGNGSNAENIIRYFHRSGKAEVKAVFSNNKKAPVLKKAHQLGVKAIHFDKQAIYHSNEILNLLKDIDPDLIVLAGFLWIFPARILKKFPNRVINLHPALLPKYGGKGMYGMKVHHAVLADKELESGISIHYVNEQYDKGELLFQKKIKVDPLYSAEELAHKIHELEYKYFPQVIEQLLFSGPNE